VSEIPEVVVLRLPLYARALELLRQEGVEVISSQGLGARLQVTPAQIRKDLSYFGRFGKQGRGYNVSGLLGELRQILGLDREWPIAVVGVGRLGGAIISYPGFGPHGFRVVAAFDTDPFQIGERAGGLVVQSMDELKSTVHEKGIELAVVAVPPSQAQAVIDALVDCGVKAILNYAPVAARVPQGVLLREVDPVVSLQSMTFHLKSMRGGPS